MSKHYGEFQGMWIPAEIWWDDSLSLQEKCFLIRIHHLDNGEDGCYANNEYFANFFKISPVRVSKIINNLVRKKMVTSQIIVGEGNKRKLKTLANIPLRPSQTKVCDPRKLSDAHKNRIKSISKNILSLVPDAPQPEITEPPVPVVEKPKSKKKPVKRSTELSKGAPEWYVKMDTIYLAGTKPMHEMPVKKRIITQIFDKTLAARPDKATEAFLAKHPANPDSFKTYSYMLQAYGIAKTLHVLLCQIRPPEKYKVMRETKVEKSIDHARMLLQIDKQTPERIKDVMDWMFTEKNDPFWRNTIYSIDAFRKYFDKISGKMEDDMKKEAEKVHQPGFTLNHD